MQSEIDKNIPNLTPIRGIAAILVVVFHFEILLVLFLPPAYSMFFRKCYLMVDLFFILSGCVLHHVYGNAFTTRLSAVGFKNYMLSRLARIYPLHLFTLLAIIILVLVSGQPLKGIYDIKAIPTNLALLQSFGLHPIFTWNVPSWSISAEFLAYLLFPFACWLLGKNKF